MEIWFAQCIRRWLVAGRVGWVLCAGLLVVSPAAAQEPPAEGFRMRVDVRLVMVPASVSSRDGKQVSTLTSESFEIFVDGMPRPIRVFERSTKLPLQLVLLLDTSLSAAKELPSEKEAMARFITRALRPEDAAALVEMAGDARIVVEFSSDPAELRKSLKKIKPRAGTALYDALIDASAMLLEREGRRVVVLISDGNDTTSKSDYQAALQAVQEADVTLFALVIRPIAGESGRSIRGEHVLISIADMTGGQVFFPAGPAQMDKFFDELSEVLRTQYLLGFSPLPGGLHSEYREITVRVKGGGYLVRHRKGYYTDSIQ